MTDFKEPVDKFARRPMGMRMAMLVRMWRSVIDHAVADTGLTQASWTVLMQLSQLGDKTPVSALAHAHGIELPPLTRTLTVLELRGFISRTPDPADKRVKLIALTASGRKVLESVSHAIETCQKRLTQTLTTEEMDTFSDTLNKLAANTMDMM